MQYILSATLIALVILPGIVAALNLADVPCGEMQSRKYFGRIMGGSVADISDFPYAVSLKRHGEHYCGGSLINKYYVLTAAHCVKSTAPGIWNITVGEQDKTKAESHEQTIAADSIIIHNDFQMGKYEDDIAIIRLRDAVTWSEHAQPICLPNSEEEEVDGKHGLLAGWGFDKEEKDGGKMTDELNFVRLPIMNSGKCQEKFDTVNKENKKSIKIVNQQVCAGHTEGKMDGCQADSGAGLVTENEQKMVIVGIMSSSLGCGRPNVPGVYTRIPSYLGWIKDTIAKWDDASTRDSRQHWTGLDTEHRLSHLKREVEKPILMDFRVRSQLN